MANICIPPELVEQFKQIVSSDIPSVEKAKLLEQNYGPEIGQQLHLKYERSLLASNYENAFKRMLDDIQMTPEKRALVEQKIAENLARKEGIITDQELTAIVKNVIDNKFDIALTPDQAQVVTTLNKTIKTELKKGLDKEGNYSDLFGSATDDLNEYIKTIKDPASTKSVTFENGKLNIESNTLGKQIKYNFSKIEQEVKAAPDAATKGYVLAKESAKFISSPIFKTLKASIDASYLGIQGTAIATQSPKIFKESVAKSLEALSNPEALRTFRTKVFSWGGYDDAIASGLRLLSKEEQFASNIAEKLPGIGRLIKKSDDAFTVFLQNARMEEYKRVLNIRNLQRAKEGLPPLDINRVVKGIKVDAKVMEEIASHANKVTGTSNLGSAEKHASLLNSVMFAGRYAVSDIRNFTDVLNPMLSSDARKLAATTLAKNAGLMYGAYITYSMLHPQDTEINPNSANFMKIKDNNGVMVGPKFKGQWMVQLIAKLLQGEEKSATGKITRYGEGYKAKTRADVILHTARGKLAPIPSVLADVFVGKDFANKPITLGGEAKNLASPIAAGNIITDAFKSGDPALKQLQNAFYQVTGFTAYEVGK